MRTPLVHASKDKEIDGRRKSKTLSLAGRSVSASLFASPGRLRGKNGDKLLDSALHSLLHALADPHEVANLLLLQLEICVEDAHVRLGLESQLQLHDFVLVELIVQAEGLGRRVQVLLEDASVQRVDRDHSHELRVVVDLGELVHDSWIEGPDAGVELLANGFSRSGLIQRGPEGVRGEGERVAICARIQQLSHDATSLSSHGGTERGKVFHVVPVLIN